VSAIEDAVAATSRERTGNGVTGRGEGVMIYANFLVGASVLECRRPAGGGGVRVELKGDVRGQRKSKGPRPGARRSRPWTWTRLNDGRPRTAVLSGRRTVTGRQESPVEIRV